LFLPILTAGCGGAPPAPGPVRFPDQVVYEPGPANPPTLTVEEARHMLPQWLALQDTYQRKPYDFQSGLEHATWTYDTGPDLPNLTWSNRTGPNSTRQSSHYKNMGTQVIKLSDNQGGVTYMLRSGTRLAYTRILGHAFLTPDEVVTEYIPLEFLWQSYDPAKQCADAIWVLQQALSGARPYGYFERGTAHLKAGRTEEARADAVKMMAAYPLPLRFQRAFSAANALDYLDAYKRHAVTQEAIAKARQSEQSGDWLIAFQEYDRAFQWTADDTLSHQFAGHMIRIYPKLPVKPELPEEARRFAIQAEAAVKEERYADAIKHLADLTWVAPWWPNARYDMALLNARMEQYDTAIVAMKAYLSLCPDAPNARKAQDQIYEWEGRGKK
jgi:tetratricopeptide (TPR) repeat protein